MIGYVTFGTNDLARARAFYDPIAEIFGQTRIATTDRMVMWGTPEKAPMFCAIKPFNDGEATGGNGTMVALKAESEEQVRRVYEHALANGGSDEGPPGRRNERFYAAYFRDPDGNKLVAYLHEVG